MNLIEAEMPYLGASQYLGTHKPIIDKYNTLNPLPRGYRMKYNDYWCMAFQSVGAMLAGAPKNFPYECSCQKAVESLQSNGLWIENDAYYPEKNDLVFYHWADNGQGDCNHTPNHVGCVAYVKNEMIKVLEGNFNGVVKYRDIPLNYRYIRGFGHTSTLWKEQAIDNTLIAHQVIDGLYGNYPERKEKLEALGYDYYAVQTVVNALLENQNNVENEYDLKEVALRVLRGWYGNGEIRKTKLTNEGYDYDAVMEIVNNYYKRR